RDIGSTLRDGRRRGVVDGDRLGRAGDVAARVPCAPCTGDDVAATGARIALGFLKRGSQRSAAIVIGGYCGGCRYVGETLDGRGGDVATCVCRAPRAGDDVAAAGAGIALRFLKRGRQRTGAVVTGGDRGGRRDIAQTLDGHVGGHAGQHRWRGVADGDRLRRG